MNLYISDNVLYVYIFGVLGIWACTFILKIIVAIKLFNLCYATVCGFLRLEQGTV